MWNAEWGLKYSICLKILQTQAWGRRSAQKLDMTNPQKTLKSIVLPHCLAIPQNAASRDFSEAIWNLSDSVLVLRSHGRQREPCLESLPPDTFDCPPSWMFPSPMALWEIKCKQSNTCFCSPPIRKHQQWRCFFDAGSFLCSGDLTKLSHLISNTCFSVDTPSNPMSLYSHLLPLCFS